MVGGGTEISGEELFKKQESILKWLPKCKYQKSAVCRKVKISRGLLNKWLDEFPEFKDAYDELLEEQKDKAEAVMMMMWEGIPDLDEKGKQIGWIQKPDFRFLNKFLDAKAPERGYKTESSLTLKKDLFDELEGEELIQSVKDDIKDLEDDEWDTSQDDE